MYLLVRPRRRAPSVDGVHEAVHKRGPHLTQAIPQVLLAGNEACALAPDLSDCYVTLTGHPTSGKSRVQNSELLPRHQPRKSSMAVVVQPH